MDLTEYFDKTRGFGILATADSNGKVNVAAFSKPTIMEDGSAAFLMSGHLTYHNLQSNPHAAYCFVEHGESYGGKRLYLTKTGEDEDLQLIEKLRKKRYPIFTTKYNNESKYVVFFKIDKILPLVADGILKSAREVRS